MCVSGAEHLSSLSSIWMVGINWQPIAQYDELILPSFQMSEQVLPFKLVCRGLKTLSFQLHMFICV